MVFLADHLGWLVVCGLLLVYVVFPSWGGPRRSALSESGRSAARPDSGTVTATAEAAERTVPV